MTSTGVRAARRINGYTATVLAAVAALSLAACGSDNNSTTNPGPSAGGAIACMNASGTLSGAGSTFQKPIEAEWTSGFDAACSGVTVDYQGGGSGAGITQFGAGTIDFAGSDATMKPDEQTKADARCKTGKAIHVPVTAGAVVPIYHLSSVTSLQLSAKTLAGIFGGTISTWDNAAIKADNPTATLPGTAIQAFYRNDSSGTTKVFTGFLDKMSGGTWKLGADKDIAFPNSLQGKKGSDGVSGAVSATDGGISYTELSYAKLNGITYAKVQNASGAYVEPTAASVAAALATATVTANGNDLQAKLDFAAADPAAFPISAVSYVITCEKGTAAGKVALLKAYLTFATGKGQDLADANGFAPLPSSIASKVTTAVAAIS